MKYRLIFYFRNHHEYHVPLGDSTLECLSKKNFAPKTMKKVNWVCNMFQEWRGYRNAEPEFSDIHCDLDNLSSISEESLIFAMIRFITEVKKMDGNDFPPKTLYEIVVCMQFYLETKGFTWKLLSDDTFKDIRFTLDNTMKQCTQQGLGNSARKAQVLSITDKDILWNIGLLGTDNPEVLLQTVMFTLGLSYSLQAGKEHYVLRSIPFDLQFTFLYDSRGRLYFKFCKDVGLKTNKGGIKHRKLDPKVVDVYQINNAKCCPVRILQLCMSLLPKNRKCKALYLQPHKKYDLSNWFRDAPVGENKLRSFVKDICDKAGIPGYYSYHSLRAVGCTQMYNSGIEEQVIQEISGHRSLAVRSYKRTCDKQRENTTKSIFW